MPVSGFLACLMSNHVHLIAAPDRADSMSVLLRHVHGRYAQYYNARTGRVGHLWQNRFFSCMLAPDHLWTAMAYIERNPMRARIVRRAQDLSVVKRDCPHHRRRRKLSS
jgi:putative transposase